MRILVLAHGHPDLSPGGGERAAYAMFTRLRQSSCVTHTAFAAFASPELRRLDAARAILERPEESLVTPPPVDGFTFQSFGLDELKGLVEDLIAKTRPDIVHIHHFVFWGLEIAALFKQAGVRVVLTLHEYAAICAQYGQMITPEGRLCHAPSPAGCSQCFPTISAGRFFVRTTIIRSLLGHVDEFIAPSNFLRDRYIAWGLPSDRVTVIENLLDEMMVSQARTGITSRRERSETRDDSTPCVLGYFAQINPFKGLDVLLEAVSLLPRDIRGKVTVRVHGENTHYRETEFSARTERLLAKVEDVVVPMGSYGVEKVIALMAACDWIVVPSIWWENSPVVMQEARLAERPLIASDIGGMAEKCDPEADHLFAVNNAGALARLISDLVRYNVEPNEEHLRALAEARIQQDEVNLARHCTIYNRLLAF